jgi:hypothetical protein
MPYKTGEFKGELTAAEIRKLIRGHNKLVSLKIPPGLDRNGLIKFLARNKYDVDHKNKKLINKVPSRYTQVSLERAERITKRKPKEKKEPEKKPEKRKSDSEILKENGYPTLGEYKENITKLRDGKPLSELPLNKRKEIVKYVEKTAKDLGVNANINASPKQFFENQVGNLERQFGFLAQKIREGKEGKKEPEKKEPEKKLLAIEDKPEKKPEKTKKNFKVERFERTRLINDLSKEIGKKFDPFKILGIKASEETPELVKSRCRELRLKNHPDKGGDKEKFDLIQKACDILLKTQTLINEEGKEEKKNVPEGVSENVLKSLIKELLEMITLKEIKKQKSKKDLEELFKTAVRHFNDIQKTFSNKYGFKTKKEQRAWFEDNGLSFDKYDTENNLLRRRVKEQLKKV